MKSAFRSAIAAAVLLSAFGLASAGAQTPQGAWALAGKMTTVRTDIGVIETGGKIYVMGGQANGSQASPMAQEFDPATGSWRDLAPMPKGASHVGVAAMNGKVYVAGGFLANVHRDPQAYFFEYDIAANQWRELPAMPAPLGSVGLAAAGGKLHVVGGRGPDAKTVTSHFVFDPVAGRWGNAAPLPLARDHLGIVALDSKIYVIGGRTGATVDNTGQTDVYDPAADRWQTVAAMPTGRSSPSVAVYRGQIVFVGGECKNAQTRATFDEAEAYDPKANRWTVLAKHPTGIHAGGLASVGNTAYLFSGNRGCGGDNPSNDIYTFKMP